MITLSSKNRLQHCRFPPRARDPDQDAELLRQIHDYVNDLPPADDGKRNAIKIFVATQRIKIEKTSAFNGSQVVQLGTCIGKSGLASRSH